jgi:anti-anti-sigma factor
MSITPTGASDPLPSLTIEQVTVGDVAALVVTFPEGKPATGSNLSLVIGQLSADRPCRVILDLGHVDQVQGPFFGELLKLMKLLKGSGGSLKLCQLQPSIYDVLRVTRMERLFEIVADRATALAQLSTAQESPPK